MLMILRGRSALEASSLNDSAKEAPAYEKKEVPAKPRQRWDFNPSFNLYKDSPHYVRLTASSILNPPHFSPKCPISICQTSQFFQPYLQHPARQAAAAACATSPAALTLSLPSFTFIRSSAAFTFAMPCVGATPTRSRPSKSLSSGLGLSSTFRPSRPWLSL